MIIEKTEFKLIGIKTGEALTEKEKSILDFENMKEKEYVDFLKNLKPNTVFPFFDYYQISTDSKEVRVDHSEKIKNLIYLEKNKNLNVEISAVVGENGSGKSTLIDLIYLAVHNLAVETKVLFYEDKKQVKKKQKYLSCELFFLTKDGKCLKLKFHYNDTIKECQLFDSDRSGDTFVFTDKSKTPNKEDLKDIFYSIAVNYSIYGLNSRHTGKWINHLFHKNDSYQTPLVINPMRSEGNFSINREEYLSKYRLLSNSINKFKESKGEVYISKNINLKELIFKLDESKIGVVESFLEESKDKSDPVDIHHNRWVSDIIRESKFEIEIDEIVKRVILIVLKKEFDSSSSVKYKKEIQEYILIKLYKTCFNYQKYWKYLDYGKNDKPIILRSIFRVDRFDELLTEIGKDKSHVTLKLRQALNYLVNDPLNSFLQLKTDFKGKRLPNSHWVKHEDTGEVYRIPFSIFASNLLEYDDELINCIPPTIFSLTILVQRKNDDKIFDIAKMSSGESQMINSVQSTIYHLTNLNSYKNNTDSDKVLYHSALVLFDEIELYFHPNYQRMIIRHFLNELDAFQFDLLTNVHIIFFTHSPFILSDIPAQNILRLEDGAPSNKEFQQTFGANIHDLLANDFFLEDGFMGEFAKERINDLVNYLTFDSKQEVSEQNVKSSFQWTEDNASKFIELVGEPLLKYDLKELYLSKFYDSDRINKEIERLEELKKRKKNQHDID